MMPLFDRKPRFMLNGSGIISVSFYHLMKQRSERRLMLPNSCTDIRAWSSVPLEYTKYFQEQAEQNYSYDPLLSRNAMTESELKPNELSTLTEEFKKFIPIILTEEQKKNLENAPYCKDDIIYVKSGREYNIKNEGCYISRSTSPLCTQDECKHSKSESELSLNLKNASVQVTLEDVPQNAVDSNVVSDYLNQKQNYRNVNHSKSSSQSSDCDSSDESDSHSFICSEINKVEKKYETLKQEFITQESMILSLEYQLKVKEKDIEELKDKNETLQITLDNIEVNRKNLQEKIKEISQFHQKELHDLKNEFQYQIKGRDDALKSYKKQAEELHSQINELTYENKEIRAITVENERKNQCKNQDIRKLVNEKLKEIEKQNQECEKHMNMLKTMIKERERMSKENDYLQQELRQLKSELKESKKRKKYVLNPIINDQNSSKLPLMMINECDTSHSSVEDISDEEECLRSKKLKKKEKYLIIEERQDTIKDDDEYESADDNSEGLKVVDSKLKVIKQDQSDVNCIKDYKIENEELLRQIKEKEQEVKSLQEQSNQYINELNKKSHEAQEIPQLRLELDKKIQEIENLNTKISEYTSKENMNRNLEEIEKLRNELKQASIDLREQEKEQQIFEENVRSWKTSLETENVELKTTLSQISLQKGNLQRQLEQILAESKSKDLQIQRFSTKLELLSEIKMKFENMRINLNLLQDENEKLRNEIRQRNDDVQKYKEKVNELAEKNAAIIKIKKDDSEVRHLKSEIECRDQKIEELEKEITKQKDGNDELKSERDVTKHLLIIYSEVSKVCEEKWNLEDKLRTLKMQLKGDQSENRKLENELKHIERENDVIKMEITRLKNGTEQLKADLLLKKPITETRLSGIIDQLCSHITLLKEKCLSNDVEHAELNKNINQHPRSAAVEKHNKATEFDANNEASQENELKEPKVNFDQIMLENCVKNLNEEKDKLLEELKLKENQYNQRLMIMQQQYESQLQSLRKDHNNSIEQLMKTYDEHQRNPQILLNNEEWLKDLDAKDAIRLYNQMTKYLDPETLRNEFEDYVSVRLKQSDSEIHKLKEILDKLQFDNEKLVKENEDIQRKLSHEEKYNERLLEKLHDKERLNSLQYKTSDKPARKTSKSDNSSRKSYGSSEFSESDRSHCESHNRRNISSKNRKKCNKLSTGPTLEKNHDSKIEDFIRRSIANF